MKTLPSIANHAKQYSIKPLKNYSQNFIFDFSLCQKIVKYSGIKAEDLVLEIGPGIGGLTRAILEIEPHTLIVIEKDKRCIELLNDIKKLYNNLSIINDDALTIDIEQLYPSLQKPINIISNLPYQIGTVLVINWLKKLSYINSITVMLQKEVADRICAIKGTKDYGRLSILCQLLTKVTRCFNVSPSAFYPPPKVESTVIKLSNIQINIDIQIINIIEKITELSFNQRRKMIKSSLSKIDNILNILNHLNIDSDLRAQDLSPEEYYKIAKYIFDSKNQ